MAISNDKLLADQAIVFSDWPTESITISGTTYQCLKLEDGRGNTWGEGGRINEYTVRVTIERSGINSSIPAEGTICSLSGTEMRISNVDRGDAAQSIILTLENITLA